MPPRHYQSRTGARSASGADQNPKSPLAIRAERVIIRRNEEIARNLDQAIRVILAFD